MLGCFLSVNPVFLSMGGRGIRERDTPFNRESRFQDHRDGKDN
jgi:hypothetical protein